jgi:hypothetical protein
VDCCVAWAATQPRQRHTTASAPRWAASAAPPAPHVGRHGLGSMPGSLRGRAGGPATASRPAPCARFSAVAGPRHAGPAPGPCSSAPPVEISSAALPGAQAAGWRRWDGEAAHSRRTAVLAAARPAPAARRKPRGPTPDQASAAAQVEADALFTVAGPAPLERRHVGPVKLGWVNAGKDTPALLLRLHRCALHAAGPSPFIHPYAAPPPPLASRRPGRRRGRHAPRPTRRPDPQPGRAPAGAAAAPGTRFRQRPGLLAPGLPRLEH